MADMEQIWFSDIQGALHSECDFMWKQELVPEITKKHL